MTKNLSTIWRTAFSALLSLTSCAGVNWPSYHFLGEGENAALVRETVAVVNALSGREWLYVDESSTIVFSSNVELFKHGGAPAIGWFDIVNNTIMLKERAADGTLDAMRAQVLLHEMGHAVGLSHESSGVMTALYHPMPYSDAVDSFVATALAHKRLPCKAVIMQEVPTRVSSGR